MAPRGARSRQPSTKRDRFAVSGAAARTEPAGSKIRMSMSEADADVTASAFDPLAAMQALEAAGINRKHAEAIAEQLRVVTNANPDPLAASTGPGLFRRELESFHREVRYGLGIVTALSLTIAGRLFGIL